MIRESERPSKKSEEAVEMIRTTNLQGEAKRVAAPGLTTGSAARRVEIGDSVTPGELQTISGETVPVPDGEQYVHLQFRRFAGCPVCSLHPRSFGRRHAEIAEAGVRKVVVFHSEVEELNGYVADVPLMVVADPRKILYVEFGVESSPHSVLNPRAWLAIIRGVLLSLWQIIFNGKPAPSLNPAGGRFGLPSDFLIASDGTVIASKYGAHVYDQWSVDELLEQVHGRNLFIPREAESRRPDRKGGAAPMDLK